MLRKFCDKGIFKKALRVGITAAVALAVVFGFEFSISRASNDCYPIVQRTAKTYTLENMTEKQRFGRLSSVTLYADGTAGVEYRPSAATL